MHWETKNICVICFIEKFAYCGGLELNQPRYACTKFFQGFLKKSSSGAAKQGSISTYVKQKNTVLN